MAKLTRVHQKQFGVNAGASDVGVFGSLAAASPQYSKDPETIQGLAAFLTGWAAETIANNRPALEDFNALDFLSFYQLCYLFQSGVPEWSAETTYYENSICQVDGVLYRSLQDDNLDEDPESEAAYWAKVINSGTGANQLVQLDGDAKLPAVDGSQLTNLPIVGFGNWVDKTASYGAQQATTDGFVVASFGPSDSNGYATGYTDGNANPTTVRCRQSTSFAGAKGSFTMPVKKSDYWKIVSEGTGITIASVYWIPLEA